MEVFKRFGAAAVVGTIVVAALLTLTGIEFTSIAGLLLTAFIIALIALVVNSFPGGGTIRRY
jgi:hypothetical protein